MSLVESCKRYVMGSYSDDDLLKILRHYAFMWGRILGHRVVLGFEHGEITISPSFPGPTGKFTTREALSTKRTALGEVALYLQTIGKLDREFRNLKKGELEAIFWRLIDCSTYRDKNGRRRGESNRSLAQYLGVLWTTFHYRLYRAWEKLGGDPQNLMEYVAYACAP
jgi:hypothetical protein